MKKYPEIIIEFDLDGKEYVKDMPYTLRIYMDKNTNIVNGLKEWKDLELLYVLKEGSEALEEISQMKSEPKIKSLENIQVRFQLSGKVLERFIRLCHVYKSFLMKEIMINLTTSRLRINRIDPTLASIINAEITKTNMDSLILEEQKEYNIALDITNITKNVSLSKSFKNQKLEFLINEKEIKLDLNQGENITIFDRLYGKDILQKEFNLDALELYYKFKIDPIELTTNLNKLKTQEHEHVIFELDETEDLYMTSPKIEGNEKITYKFENIWNLRVQDHDLHSQYSLSYLKKFFSKTKGLFSKKFNKDEQIQLDIDSEMPLIFQVKDFMEITFVLAPTRDDEEDDSTNLIRFKKLFY